MDEIYTKTFKDGLKLIFKNVDDTLPACVNITIGVGSVNESDDNLGISHFVEHLNFDGTYTRTDKEISAEFENLGVIKNAATGSFRTYYFAIGASQDVEKIVEILSDIIFSSSYTEEAIAKESSVVCEEISINEDNSNAVLEKKFLSMFYRGTKMEKNALGTRDTIKKMTRDDIVKYVKKYYVPSNIIVSIVAHSSYDDIVKIIDKYINSRFDATDAGSIEKVEILKLPEKSFCALRKNIVHTIVALGFPTIDLTVKDRMVHSLISYMFGTLETSPLFSKVRQEEGLVYDIDCISVPCERVGEMHIGFSTDEENVSRILAIIKNEILKVVKNGFSKEELDRAKITIKSTIRINLETTFEQSDLYARQMSLFGKLIPVRDILDILDNVTLEEVNEEVKKVFDFNHMCGCSISRKADYTVFDLFK